jgi:NAD-dependent deacetylase
MNDIEKLQELIDNSNYIVFFGGAGVSTESGIKDFRGKNGLYKEKNKYSIYPPEYLLSNSCLMDEPELFFNYYREKMDARSIKPNITHNYLKKLEDIGKLKAIVTQNIDGLHQKAGSKNVLEVHGTTYKCHCMKCNKEYPGDIIFSSSGIPKCDCGGTIRPNVTLYGEMLPEDFDIARKEISKADLLIVAGTSLTVQPASSLINYFNGKHLVIINDSITPYDYLAELVIHKSLGEVFKKLK